MYSKVLSHLGLDIWVGGRGEGYLGDFYQGNLMFTVYTVHAIKRAYYTSLTGLTLKTGC